MLEIFLGRSIDSRKFDLWSNCFFSLAHSTGRHEWFACASRRARTTHNRPARPMHAAVPDREFIILDAPQTQPSSARLRCQQAARGRLKPGARQTV